MLEQPDRSSAQAANRPPFECIALLLQGGGALGAYQAGVYQALAEAKLHPDWIAGISIGAINSAIIAGNAPEARVDKLREFWESITTTIAWGPLAELWTLGEARKFRNQFSATYTLFGGASKFFTLRLPTPWLQLDGSPAAISYYDTKKLKTTLERLIDFDLINSGKMRVSIGAVAIETGNFAYFDSTTCVIRPEHIMASGALPPALPPIEIDGEHYWDGGLVSNTPLQWVLQYGSRQDTLAFQVDLWNARGSLPRNMIEVTSRQKGILYSSRTRENTERFIASQKLRHAVANLLQKLPQELTASPEVALLNSFGDHKVYNVVHLIYRAKQYEDHSKDYEFSRLSMSEHWEAGYRDTVSTLSHPEVLRRPTNPEGLAIFDVAERDNG
jgi:NTE family protein